MNLQQHKALKLIFFGGGGGGASWSWFEVVSPKRAKVGPKLVFEKSVDGTVLIFCMKLLQHEGLKLNQLIFVVFIVVSGSREA